MTSDPSQQINLADVKDAVNFYDLALYFEEKNIQTSYNAVKISCPFHEDKTPSFFYNIEKKFCYCFSCKRHLDVITYVMEKKSCSFKDALDFLMAFFKINGQISIDKKSTNNFKKELDAINKYKPKDLNEFEYFTEQDVEEMISFRKSLKLRTIFNEETLDHFEAGFDPKEKRIVVPIRDQEKQLVGVTGRTIETKKIMEEKKIPKWRHYKGSNCSKTFFNINNAISESISKDNSIIIVEGPKDVMWLHQNGIRNVIACLTNNISPTQKGILLKNFISVYLMLDADSGGDIGKSDILEKISGYFNIYDVEIEKGKDPDQLSRQELEDVLRQSKKIR